MHKCIYCGKEPRVVEISGLFYVQCCDKFNPYEFCGITPRTAKDSWDAANSLGAKINMEHAKEAARYGPYFYIVDGTRYDTVAEACKAANCAIKSLYSKFGLLTKTTIIRGHVVTRVRRAKKRGQQ